jgi:FkbM family methyltransferase
MSLRMRVADFAARAIPRSLAAKVRENPLGTIARSALNAVVPADLQVVVVRSGPLAGARMLLDLKQEKGFFAGTFEPWIQDTMVERLAPGDCAWDVGGHVGYHTLLLQRLIAPGRVVVVEPSPDLLERLAANIELNGVREHVTIVEAAAADEDGTLSLVRHQHAIENSVGAAGNGDVAIRAVRLDSLLGEHPAPALVKMDIEGGERAALEGARRLLDDVRPLWLMELHWDRGLAALDTLEAHGYRCRPFVGREDVRQELARGGTRHVLAEPQ